MRRYPRSVMFKESDQAKSGKTSRDGYVSFGHPSVMLKLDSGESVEIDKGVIDLIKLMNSIPGIETKGSCQGEDPNYGYVRKVSQCRTELKPKLTLPSISCITF